MSEETTKEQNGARSFEERILARFDRLDARLDTIDARLEKIETNPVWTEALTFLNEMHREMQAGFRNTDRKIGVLSNEAELASNRRTSTRKIAPHKRRYVV